MTNYRQRPEYKPETLKVAPLQPVPIEEKRSGRPRKLVRPPMPLFEMNELEQQWYKYFIDSYNAEYPDLTDSDQISLMLAAIEFIKYLRVAQDELSTGQVISMARQHPGTNMRALLDQLSVTRKQRGTKPTPEDQEREELRQKLLGLSQ